MKTLKLENLISENADVFKNELKKVINPSFTGQENPKKYESILNNTLVQSKRTSLLRQSQLVAAATEYLESKKNKSLILSAEMGTGKTDMAIKISLSNKLCPVYMIVCPPHLVRTWTEELEANYRDPKAYKVVRVKRYEDIAKYSRRNLWNDGIKYYFIITRENLKLSYPKEVAVSIKKKHITKEAKLDGQTYMLKTLVNVAVCPDCNSTIIEGTENSIDLENVPKKCDCGCVLRQSDRSRSKNLRTREAIADYVFKNFTKGSYNVILDEAHEYKGGDTGQGNAMGRIVANARKTIALTGTLMNGYASSLFFLLYRLNPNMMKNDLGFDYNHIRRFVETYGAHEETFAAKTVNQEGVVTRKGARTNIKERAKISPHLLSVLLGMTIFLKLDEIKMPNNLQLPPYEEIVDLVPMEDSLKYPYIDYIRELSKEIRHDKRLLGNLATDAIAIPDMPFIARSAQNKIHYNPKLTREEFGLTNKEKRLVENVGKELEQGRDCLVYITFSNQQVATDLLDILSDAFPTKTIKFLPSTVPAASRKEWIEKNPSDVLICNPELVKTGLTLLSFVSIIFYETTYNVFTLKQASRRSWRIGQTEDIKVIFMAYENTPQHKALELIGAKISAANSIEGKFSDDDDLSSMGEDDGNIQMMLAKSILNEETHSSNIEMTSIKKFGGDREFNTFENFYQGLIDIDKSNRETNIDLSELKVENITSQISEHKAQDIEEYSLFNAKEETIIDTQIIETIEVVEQVVEVEDFKFVAIIGKGKREKRVEIKPANNMQESIANAKLDCGTQLAFAF
jgi:SNF2 family DNA or RNA helicase